MLHLTEIYVYSYVSFNSMTCFPSTPDPERQCILLIFETCNRRATALSQSQHA